MTGVNAVQALGILLLVAAVVGGGVKLAGNEFPVISSIPRAVVVGLVGIALIVVGPTVVERYSRFRVTSVHASWDQTQGNACKATQSYTVFIETAGGSGQVQYRLMLDGQRFDIKSIDTPEPKTYSATGAVTFPYSKANIPGTAKIRIEVLSPTTLTSDVSSMDLICAESTEALQKQLQQFVVNYQAAVDKYGRSSSAVTHEFFAYPLTWYGQPPFDTEDDFACYIEHCGEKEKVTKSGVEAKCKFEAPVVKQVKQVGRRISFESSVDWSGKKSGLGQTRVLYQVDQSDSGEPFRIRSVKQPRSSETCK